MADKSYMPVFKSALFILVFSLSFNPSQGQQTPNYPLSYRIFSPQIFNPAIVGSKDYFAIDLITGKCGESNSQVLSGNLRLEKSHEGYFSSSGAPEFTNIGVGGFLFNDFSGLWRNIGIGGSASYHLPLGKDALSFLSVGASAKAVFNKYSGDPDLGESAQSMFFPNFDAGVYYYNANLFAGLSATNLLGQPKDSDTLDSYTIPVSRQLFFQIGYKVVLIKSWNLILEPSLIMNSDDSFSGEVLDMIEPALKLYADNFCVGTYFNDFDKTSVFFQYKYQALYIGTYFEMQNGSPFYKTPLRAELILGLNLSKVKSGISRHNHW
ncbi:MAG: PorP/SprF family type IX secretion system membrane protein [Bacteroidales bacterium]|jgi:type IX secretion system PorP/SprF family membrane protein|nr:PorP/SprF family type IX secretion system membrane protein [Bacteroidales bacterium]